MAGQIIGKSTLTGTPTSISATSPKLLYGTGQESVLGAGQKLISVNIGWGGKSANPTGSPSFQVGLYDVTGSDYTTADLLFAQTFNISNTALSGAQFVTVALNEDFSAHAGKTLAVGISAPSVGNAFDVLIETVTGATRKNGAGTSSTLTATLASGSVSSNQAWAAYFVTDDLAPPISVDSVTNPLVVGSAGSITSTGLGTLTSIAVKTAATPAATVNVASLSAPSGDGTFTMPNWVDDQFYPFAGSVTVTASDGTNSADYADTLNIPATHASVTFNTVNSANDAYLGYHLSALGHALVNGDKGYYPTAGGLVISADSGVVSDDPMSFTLYVHKLSGIIESYSVNVTENGVSVRDGITSKQITGPSITNFRITY